MRIVIYGYKDPNHMVMNEGDIVQFGECPVEIKPSESITTFVDGVVDSSRYYVVRIKVSCNQSMRGTFLTLELLRIQNQVGQH
jgi:hypothetical protein